MLDCPARRQAHQDFQFTEELGAKEEVVNRATIGAACLYCFGGGDEGWV